MSKADLEQKILQSVQEYEKANPERSVYDILLRTTETSELVDSNTIKYEVVKIECIIHQNV